MHKSLEERKRKWLHFLNNTDGVRTIYLIDIDEASSDSAVSRPPPRPLPWPELINKRIGWAYENYAFRLEQMEWLPDDRIPCLSPYTGTEIFAQAFGCDVHYPENDMPFALPKYDNILKAASLKIPNVHDTPLDNLFEIARQLRQKAGDGAPMHLPDIQSPLDIAALILDKEAFYVAMVEEPQAIQEIIEKTKTLLTTFLDEWFAEFGHTYVAHFPSYYMSGGITLSEDEVGAFSASMFDMFVLGTLNELSDKYGGIGIHCCADSEHQWDNFLKVKDLKIINLCNKENFIKRSVGYFASHAAQWPIDGSPVSEKEPLWFADRPSGTRAVLTYLAPTRQAALDIAARAETFDQ